MSTTQTVTARQDSELIDDIEKKDVDTPSSNEKLDYVETIDFDSTDDRSEQLRLKEVEELEVLSVLFLYLISKFFCTRLDSQLASRMIRNILSVMLMI